MVKYNAWRRAFDWILAMAFLSACVIILVKFLVFLDLMYFQEVIPV